MSFIDSDVLGALFSLKYPLQSLVSRLFPRSPIEWAQHLALRSLEEEPPTAEWGVLSVRLPSSLPEPSPHGFLPTLHQAQMAGAWAHDFLARWVPVAGYAGAVVWFISLPADPIVRTPLALQHTLLTSNR